MGGHFIFCPTGQLFVDIYCPTGQDAPFCQPDSRMEILFYFQRKPGTHNFILSKKTLICGHSRRAVVLAEAVGPAVHLDSQRTVAVFLGWLVAPTRFERLDRLDARPPAAVHPAIHQSTVARSSIVLTGSSRLDALLVAGSSLPGAGASPAAGPVVSVPSWSLGTPRVSSGPAPFGAVPRSVSARPMGS